MGKTKRRWFGVALITGAIGVFISSVSILDTPGPMDGIKPEFTFEVTEPLVVLAVVLALAGEGFLAWKSSDRI